MSIFGYFSTAKDSCWTLYQSELSNLSKTIWMEVKTAFIIGWSAPLKLKTVVLKWIRERLRPQSNSTWICRNLASVIGWLWQWPMPKQAHAGHVTEMPVPLLIKTARKTGDCHCFHSFRVCIFKKENFSCGSRSCLVQCCKNNKMWSSFLSVTPAVFVLFWLSVL